MSNVQQFFLSWQGKVLNIVWFLQVEVVVAFEFVNGVGFIVEISFRTMMFLYIVHFFQMMVASSVSNNRNPDTTQVLRMPGETSFRKGFLIFARDLDLFCHGNKLENCLVVLGHRQVVPQHPFPPHVLVKSSSKCINPTGMYSGEGCQGTTWQCPNYQAYFS